MTVSDDTVAPASAAPLLLPEALPYIADPDLVTAAEVAMSLGKALLLTGEPGTGKTTFANHVAATLAPRRFDLPAPLPLHVFPTKSTSSATDLFYRFDSLRRFHASHEAKASKLNRDYVTFEALGLAILHTLPWEKVSHLMPRREEHPGVGRSVVLVDEIDKAPRDFPNDILNEIEHLDFRIPEVSTDDGHVARVVSDPAYRPVVVLTSNSEKNLPAAFLRRCVFHHIQFPQKEDEMKAHLATIVKAHLALAAGRMVDDAIEVFYRLRQARDIEKPPATAELIDWVRSLRERALAHHLDPAHHRLRSLELDLVRGTLGLLAKGVRDIETARKVLADFYAAQR